MTEDCSDFTELVFTANGNLYTDFDYTQEQMAETRKQILQRTERACFDLLLALGIDVTNDPNVKDTPRRMARMYVNELLRGRYEDLPELREFPNKRAFDQFYVVGPVSITSLCSHHFLPFTGECFIGLLPDPNKPVLGLSKFARMADWIFSRPQIQEEATQQLAALIQRVCRPRGLGLVVEAEHQCMTIRGVKKSGSRMMTSAMLGVFRENAAARAELFELFKLAKE